ncbi:hypothetical protein [Stutzerimonas kirkiae]|uniref:hypothetical protein n=1 Tax=Stutzerimonas kirkiae TaxID=2211392 RepID=UPI0010383B0E|nr:hypothetical protein [Stutzerimonas kirkiae]TBV10242.1 hypothetical protein DNK08_07125 [Stutzerimonas kirkiae]
MMLKILGRALTAIFSDEWFGAPRLWVPSVRYLQPWPQARPGKSGVAVARRQARKARTRRRQRHGCA